MRWTPGGRSSNLEDRRSLGGGMGRGLGIGGTVVVLALSLLFGRNLFSDLGVEPGVAAGAPMSPTDSAAQETEVQFVSFILDDVQNTWSTILPKYGARFTPARLVLFRNSTDSGCGTAQSAMGPFYCPMDERVYLDLGFFDEECGRVECAENPFGAKLLPMSPEQSVTHDSGMDLDFIGRGGAI